MFNKYKIDFIWDDEAGVWIATSEDDDISGLVLEHESFEGLVHEVRLAIPLLLDINNRVFNNLTLDFVAHRQESLVCSG